MKVMIFTILIGFMFSNIVNATEILDKRWINYGSYKEGEKYYDSLSIVRFTENKEKFVKVWDTWIYGEEGWYFEGTGKMYTRAVYLQTFNCSKREYKSNDLILYAKDGDTDKSKGNESFLTITPESAIETLFNIVCTQ